MYLTKKNIKRFFSLLVILSAGLLISSCSGGGSGGSVSSAGSSSVEGNIASVNVAMRQPANTEGFALSDFLKPLISVKSAYAATPVEGIQVEIGQMHTTTNADGYFRLDGVPPGTHELMFSKNDFASSMSVNVGKNDMVTMHDININGHQARARSISHRMSDNDRNMGRDRNRDNNH